MGNVASFLNITNDINLHGGWEGFNLIELVHKAEFHGRIRLICFEELRQCAILTSISQVSSDLTFQTDPHLGFSCLANCGGEGGGEAPSEGGPSSTWWPLYVRCYLPNRLLLTSWFSGISVLLASG